MKKTLIFCQSYPQIKLTLYLIEDNQHDSSITLVITGNKDLYKLFRILNERFFNNTVNIICLDRYRRRINQRHKLKSLGYILQDIIRERRHLKNIHDNHFSELKGADIYFFSRFWNSYAFYLLKILCRGNRLVYIPDSTADNLVLNKLSLWNIHDLAALVTMKLIFGHDITLGRYIGARFPSIPDSFMKKKVGRCFRPEERDEELKSFDLGKYRVFGADCDVIYFDHEIEQSWISVNTLREEIGSVFNILQKYFPHERIAYKNHPRHNGNASIRAGVTLEDFVPAELISSNGAKVYLSVWSSSITNVDGCTAISLIDLISLKDDAIREKIKRGLIQKSKTGILFPKSLDEFERILIDISEK